MAVKINLDPATTILAKRKLQKGGEAQILFTKECAKWMNNYVPLDTGRLKDISVEIGNDFVKYNTQYAKKQYYTNVGSSKKNKAGLRGKLWDKRMWINKSATIVKSVANFVGGRNN